MKNHETANRLLSEILTLAKIEQMDQMQLAEKAKISPETISRAKRRGTIDLGTLVALSAAVGAQIHLQSEFRTAEQNDSIKVGSTSSTRSHSLANPKWGLAWSNPHASRTSLVQNALRRGSFDALLQASLESGIDYVKMQLSSIASTLNPTFATELNRKLSNIEQGFRRAEA